MDDKLNKTIGENIKSLRKSSNMTQKELGNLLNKQLRTIQKYESGEINIPFKTINIICEIFDVTQTELLGEPQGLKKIKDDELIGELKKRGYTIYKKF